MGAQRIYSAEVGPGWRSEGELLFLLMRRSRRRGSQMVTETGPWAAARAAGWDQPKPGRGKTLARLGQVAGLAG